MADKEKRLYEQIKAFMVQGDYNYGECKNALNRLQAEMLNKERTALQRMSCNTVLGDD